MEAHWGFVYQDNGESVCILAGDIAEGMAGVRWAERYIPYHIQVLYVPGNHEYYGENYQTLNDKFRDHNTRGSHVKVLLDSVHTIQGRRFVGTTLWTNFKLYNNPLSPIQWKQGLNDSVYIRYNGYVFQSDDMISLNRNSLKFLDNTEGDVLITHYCPSTSDITKYRGDVLTPSFMTEIPEGIHNKFAYHIHGHTHCSLRYKIPRGPEVICNPRGYASKYSTENQEFQSDLIIEV
jgi:3',5'-cyclic AMP phosphodiesterase CpdA